MPAQTKPILEHKIQPDTEREMAFLFQFTGWLIALLFPFGAYGLMALTRIPLLSALIYYGIFGIYLRKKLFGRLPYLRPHAACVKGELTVFAGGALLSAALYLQGITTAFSPSAGLFLNALVFAALNGTFEHLVWVNIYELAGFRKKYMGVAACTLYVGLIHALFWSRFIPAPHSSFAWLFILSQVLVLWPPLRIYEKTGDLTFWSLQHILYNLLAVFVGGFTFEMYIHF